MSTISGVGSTGGSAWAAAATSTQRSAEGGARFEKFFAKVDGNGDGAVDQNELQGMLDHIARHDGSTAADAAEVLKKLDANGDGSLGKDELQQGMKHLRPQAASTVEMAQRRGPPHGGHGAGGGDGDGASSSGSAGSSTAVGSDPADTNGDGTVSAQERSAAMLKALRDLVSAAYSAAAAIASEAQAGSATSTPAGSSSAASAVSLTA